jgi:hypothetical protein
MKLCTNCGQTKPHSEFNKNTTKPDGFQSFCRPCQREHNFLGTYNLTLEEIDAMLVVQNNQCTICFTPFTEEKPPNVDHCHTSGKVRSMLCTKCNTALGLVDEDPAKMKRMIDYIENHAKKNGLTPVPERDNWESELHPQHGSVSPTGLGEDDDIYDDTGGAV